jgi:cytochrome P450
MEEFSGMYVAGTDTTSHLMTMCFYYLSIYPNVQ